jgi:hypothetical protein
MSVISILVWILVGATVLYFLFTDPVSFLLFGLLLVILGWVLTYFGFISAKTLPGMLDVTYRPTPVPTGIPSDSTAQGHKRSYRSTEGLPEVFNVAENKFTYDDAPAVCKAYGAELASYSQIEEAYMNGAEWCGYGWSMGGIALFPTQEATWVSRQAEIDPAKRVACGRPGINGGYFDPKMKFGVNCFGVRPPKTDVEPDQEFARSVDRLKQMLSKFAVFPFNSKEWSEHSSIKSAETHTTGQPFHDVKVGAEETAVGVQGTLSGIFKTLYGLVSGN